MVPRVGGKEKGQSMNDQSLCPEFFLGNLGSGTRRKACAIAHKHMGIRWNSSFMSVKRQKIRNCYRGAVTVVP